MPLEANYPLGVYLNDCRFVRGYELRVGGRQPRLLISTDAAGTAAVLYVTNPELTLEGQELPLQSLRTRAERRMLPDAMVERVSVRSHARDPGSRSSFCSTWTSLRCWRCGASRSAEGLHVGDARVDLLFERVGRDRSVALTDAKVKGRLDVVLEIRQVCDDVGSAAEARLEPSERGLVI